MKITGLKTAVVEGNFDWTYVRIDTDEGISGLGECFFAPGLTHTLQELSGVILGQDPTNIRYLFRRLQWATSGAGSVAGTIYNAITGIEMALWDLTGKALGIPIYRLLGGKFRDKVRIYADCHAGESLESLDAVLHTRPASWAERNGDPEPKNFFDTKTDHLMFTPEMYGARAKQVASQGFTALKFDLDVPNPYVVDAHNRCLSNPEIDYMLSLVAGVREAVGGELDIAVDCHWRLNLNDARKLSAGLEEFRLMWMEDPLPPWSTEEFRELKMTTRTPIATGENLYVFEGFRPLLERQALSVVCPDLQKAGGLGEARRIAEFADSYNIPVAPHNISSPIGTIASVHFCAATPNFLALEYHAGDVPFWDDLLAGTEKPLIREGYIMVPEGPGLGVTLNEEVARKYARPGEPFFE
ncbi:MAG TPA: mandelate racemase/muconate lactonizing enzyme family protein [Terracidiphilus sp.]|jgi:gluconate/galactonate dehydratase